MRMLLPLLLLLTACAHRPAPIARTPQPVPVSAKKWTDQGEYDLATAAARETDPAKQIELLDKWSASYPNTGLIEERQNLYLMAYQAVNDARHGFDMAQAILNQRPVDLRALADSLLLGPQIQPAPTAADLDALEKVAMRVLDEPSVFAVANRLPGTPDDAWAKTKPSMQHFAESVLLNVYTARKDDSRAVAGLTSLLQRDATFAPASYQLGVTMLRVSKEKNRPLDLPTAIYQMARAAAYDGPNAMPADLKPRIEDALRKIYSSYYGSTEGLDRLLKTAKENPFPPASFRGVTLTPLDPAIVDGVLRSGNATTRASITFVNRSSAAVDIYWINYAGERVLAREHLAAGESWEADTFLTHPWLVVDSGTGLRLAGFEALTPQGDTAIITSPTPAKAAKR